MPSLARAWTKNLVPLAKVTLWLPGERESSESRILSGSELVIVMSCWVGGETGILTALEICRSLPTVKPC